MFLDIRSAVSGLFSLLTVGSFPLWDPLGYMSGDSGRADSIILGEG